MTSKLIDRNDVRELVREKYGAAALTVLNGEGAACCAMAAPVQHKAAKTAANMIFLNILFPSLKVWPVFGRLFWFAGGFYRFSAACKRPRFPLNRPSRQPGRAGGYFTGTVSGWPLSVTSTEMVRVRPATAFLVSNTTPDAM